MVQMIDYRASENIKSISDFKNINMQNSSVFVRLVGESANFLNEVAGLDSLTSYKRVSALPQLTSTGDSGFYSGIYESYLKNRSEASLKIADGNTALARKCADVLSECLRAFRAVKSGSNASIEKNFAVTLLYRIDTLLRNCRINGSKLVVENVKSLQVYLCCYAVAQIGVNVLLLQNKCDIDKAADSLRLSASHKIGSFGQTTLPPYTRQKSASPQTVSGSGNVRIVIPPHRGRSNQVPPQNNNPQGNYGNPNSQRNTAVPPQNNNPQGNYRNPNSQRNTAVPPQNNNPQGNYRNSNSQRNTAVPPQNNNPQGNYRNPNSQRNTAVPPQNNNPMRNYQNTTPQFSRQPVSIRAEKSYEELAQLASSVVKILVIKDSRHINRNGFESCASGSGVMIGRDGYIITNCHVATAGKIYGVQIENDERIYFTDRLIKYHDKYDLALIKIDRKLNPLPIYHGSKPLVRGQKVVAIGSPLGLFNTVSDGIISGFRVVDGVDMIQFTAPISSGSSGGAVMNMYGELIGISSAGLNNDSGNAQNLNLAVGYMTIVGFCGNLIG